MKKHNIRGLILEINNNYNYFECSSESMAKKECTKRDTLAGSEEIHPNSPTIAKIRSLWNKCVVAPLLSIFAAISNKLRTGYFLTTTRVFNGISSKVIQGYEPINELKEKVTELNSNEKILIHIPVVSTVSHSTGMVIGKDGHGKVYGYVFDAQGNNPRTLPLRDYDGIANTEEFYNKIVEDLDADPLKYQNSFIQKDYISCTAYTAQWFSEAVNKDKNEISTYMRDIANHNGIAWLEARSHVSRLY